ncbi:membrane-associated protein, putative [Bodo saltans]|uniref:Membrane-associated protein, putative n=1 Tax=Bodo saltans TaxID=75058 RepID=A0A0S4IPT2_BODSA|nr:membrane-associated protein, putative [Bodo saltans]|eukprot:CUF14476.1 membrane-associated protein, putative [Bodo saltans]
MALGVGDKAALRFSHQRRTGLIVFALALAFMIFHLLRDEPINERTIDVADLPPLTTVRSEPDESPLTEPIAEPASSHGGVQGLSSSRAQLATTEETYRYFENILVIMMLSPSRYHLAEEVLAHYQPFFKNIFFCGPRPAKVGSVNVGGYNIVYGNEQYWAVRDIIRDYVVNKSASFEGVLYIGDDVLLQPWSLAAKRFNKNIPWATQMGIANLQNPKPVAAVPGMSVQGKYRSQWPYWAKNRKKLMNLQEEGGKTFKDAMYKAAKATHPLIYKWSKYSGKFATEEALHNVIFYTIVDTYYIPWRLATQYADVCDLFAKHWIFGECAIATMIRYLSPVYETMDIQFYWSTLSAADCHRYKWNVMLDGFHRCRHDHKFSHLMYGSDATRDALRSNTSYLSAALALKGLDPVKRPVQWLDGHPAP